MLSALTPCRDKQHVDWVKAYVEFLSELQVYVKKWHTTGLAWNPKGGDASAANPSAAPAPTKAVAAPTIVATPKSAMGNMFGEISGKDAVTAGRYVKCMHCLLARSPQG